MEKMNKLKLDSILLFLLVTPFVMNFRLGPNDTPYWLFGIIFAGFLVYLCLDLLSLKEHIYQRLKTITLCTMIFIVIGSAFSSAIIVRHRTHPIYMIHDIILQQEAAIRFFLDGKNPYATTYFGTPLEQWHYSDTEINPALYHFVMEPFYLLFALPFYYISNHTIGYFDGRIPLLFLFVILLITAWVVPKKQDSKRLFITLLAFNPAMLSYTLEGRSDIFMYAFLFLGFVFLEKKLYKFSAIPIALAYAVKQSVWPLAPFYVAFLYFKTRSIQKTVITLFIFVFVFGIITVPFYLWDKSAFIDSTVNYLSGNTSHSYPISGYGFGALLLSMHVIKNSQQYFPFTILQLITGVPVMIILLMILRIKTSMQLLILGYGIFLFVFWYFSRYFNNSHVGYLSMVFLSAYFFPDEETHVQKTKEKRTKNS